MNAIDYMKVDFISDFEDLKGITIIDVYNSGSMVLFTDKRTWTVISTKHDGYDEVPVICENNTVFFGLIDYHKSFKEKLEKHTDFEFTKFKSLRETNK